MSGRRLAPDLVGQAEESVWDYQRPARLEPAARRIAVVFNGLTVVGTTSAVRVLETTHTPTYYLAPADSADGALVEVSGSRYSESKGMACYWTIRANGGEAERPASSYPYAAPATRRWPTM
jgi:uncharacterized protein (DUF427 family)